MQKPVCLKCACYFRPHRNGVYYVEMPKIEQSGVGHRGAIEFGPYPFGRDTDTLKAHRWHLVPTPGLLLLFPSYYAHRTWPTGVAASRISVAFDVRPVGARTGQAPSHDW